MIEHDISLILAVYLLLLILGYLYNLLVAWAEKQKYLEGFTWLAVTVGVAITIGVMAVIDWRASLLIFGAFAFSGSPMAAGAIWRYLKARRAAQEYERQTQDLA